MRPKILGLVLLAVIVALPTFAEGLLKHTWQWRPFLERLEKDEFLAVEHALGGTLTDKKPDLLIYRASGKEIETSYTLTRQGKEDYRLEVVFGPNDPRSTKRIIKFPPDLGPKLLSTMELCLTKQLYPPTGQAYLYPARQGGAEGAYWINLRFGSTTSVAGVALTYRCMIGSSVSPFLQVMMNLARLAEMNASHEEDFADLSHSLYALERSYPAKR